jgi:tRNA splicing ligase
MTISVALADLFHFVHTQSDDIRAKKCGLAFTKNVNALLRDHEVVIADKYGVAIVPPVGTLKDISETIISKSTVMILGMLPSTRNRLSASLRSTSLSIDRTL